MSTARVTLDSPVFSGRLRQFSRGTPFIHAPQPKPSAQIITDVAVRQVQPIPQASQNLVQAGKTKPTIESTGRQVTRVAEVALPVRPRQTHSEVLQRNILSSPMAAKAVKEKRPLGQKVILVMASMVFLAGLGVAVLGFNTNKHVEAQVQAVAHSQDSDVPSEDKPDAAALANYHVAADQPRYIRISRFGVTARVTNLSTDKTGALKAPGNVFDAGWYNASSKPGEGGAVLIDGHVAGPSKHGVFYNIKDLKPGDQIELERGDGKKFEYKVVKSTVADANNLDMSAALLPVVAGKPGLNLITCTGKVTGHEYNQRITVFAVQV